MQRYVALLCFPPLTSDHTVCCSVHSLSVCLPHFVPSLQLDGQFGWRGMRSQRPRNSMPSTSCTWRSSAICLRNTRATMEWTRTHTWTLSKMNWHWSGCEWLFICKVLVLWVNCAFWLALQAQLYSQLFCLLKINKLSLIVQQDSVLQKTAWVKNSGVQSTEEKLRVGMLNVVSCNGVWITCFTFDMLGYYFRQMWSILLCEFYCQKPWKLQLQSG